jgi:orotate phosphoribosyltransferase-like protein
MSEIAHEARGDRERLKKRLLTAKDLADKLNVSEKTIPPIWDCNPFSGPWL